AVKLGVNATKVHMGEAAYFVDPLAFARNVAPPDRVWSNPRWTAKFHTSSSACITAFHQVHVVDQAALALLAPGVLLAALRLWALNQNAGPGLDELKWQDVQLIAPERKPLARADLAAEIYRSGFVSRVMAHAVYMSAWVTAEFAVDGRTLKLACDG